MSHHHHHSHDHGTEQMKSLKLVLTVSLLYMFLEIIGGIWSGSLALIADAGHMFIDSLSIGLGLFALWMSRRPANDKRTYGYHRAEILAALLNGSALIIISIWIFFEAWTRIHAPEPIKGNLMMVIAFGGLLVNTFSLFVLKKHRDHGVNMRSVWLHVFTDMLGSVAAIVAGFLILQFQWYLADPIISAAIGLMILHGAWKLVTECVDVLLESVPSELDTREIRKSISQIAGVEEIHDLHVWTLKTGTYSLSAHVRVDSEKPHGKILEEITHLIEEKFHIFHTTLQLEPEGFKHVEGHSPECNLR